MRAIDLFCASQSATAIRLGTMDQPSSSSSSLASGRAIDRHNPIIRDARRIPLPPCAAHPSPVAAAHLRRKSSLDDRPKKSSEKDGSDLKKKKKKKGAGAKPGENVARKSSAAKVDGDFVGAPDSSRYLLDDPAFLDVLPDFDPVLALVSANPATKPVIVKTVESGESSASNPKTPTSSRSPNQVVVLRVSLHCKGCEGKVRKHISRMQGVTSFNIDFAAKKVTVVGDVTPLGVLASISKVKNAQLWTPPVSSSVPGTIAAPTSSHP
ncbi:hypothetical protein NMG60_11000427 [Bertholletia excelsa]